MKFIKGDIEIIENNPNHFVILERAGFKKVEEHKKDKSKKEDKE